MKFFNEVHTKQESHDSRIKKLEDRMENCDSNLESIDSEAIRNVVGSKLEEAVDELKEKQIRTNNLIVHIELVNDLFQVHMGITTQYQFLLPP